MSATHRALVTNAKTWTTPSALPFVRQAARTELIEQSHQRCAALGLTRIERPDFEPLMRSDLSVARERNQRRDGGRYSPDPDAHDRASNRSWRSGTPARDWRDEGS